MIPSLGRPEAMRLIPRPWRARAIDRRSPKTLRDRKETVRPEQRLFGVGEPAVGPHQADHELDARLRLLQVRELLPQRLEESERSRRVVVRGRERMRVKRSGDRDRLPVSRLPALLLCGGRVPEQRLPIEDVQGVPVRTFVEIGAVRGIRRDVQRLLEERACLSVRAELGSSLGCATKGDPRLGCQRLGLGLVCGEPLGSEVVAGETTRQLLRAERLEVASGRQVPELALLPRERVVGDLANERLDEPVVATPG